jgi:hypothetical protein
MTPQRAASLAKNLTVNFNRKGQATANANALYAFFNARVQGTTRMMDVLVQKKDGKFSMTACRQEDHCRRYVVGYSAGFGSTGRWL